MNVSFGEPNGKLIGTLPWSVYALILAGKITTDEAVRPHIVPVAANGR
jgi:hypothetical protein